MTNFTVNIVSEKDDKRIPVALAGQVMVDIQDLFTHIGEYFVSRELRAQSFVDKKFDEKFRIYLDGDGGVSFSASTADPETRGQGNLVEDTVSKMEEVLDVMGNGTGSYWMEDNFRDALYRNAIIYDIAALHQDMALAEGFALEYGSSENLKKFGRVDLDKLSAFISSKGLTCDGVAIGMLLTSKSKSGKGPKYVFSTGTDVIRISFKDNGELAKASEFADKGVVVVAGKLTYSEDGKITSVADAEEMCGIESIDFRRIVSPIGDIILKTPVTAKVSFRNGKWNLSEEDLGIDESADTWDNAVQSFHDYFLFLWMHYAEAGDEGLSEEELEVKSALLSHIR